MVHAASRSVCSPGDPHGREALWLPSLPQEVSSRSTLHGHQRTNPREAFLLWALWKSFQPQWEPHGHTQGSSPTCAPSVTGLPLPGVSQIPPGNPFWTTGRGPCPRVQVLLLQEGHSQWFVTSVTQRVDDMGRASEDIGSRGFHLHEWGGYLSDGLSLPLDFVFSFSVACFNQFLLSFVILLMKACLISYQYFIMKMSLLLTAFLLGGTSL